MIKMVIFLLFLTNTLFCSNISIKAQMRGRIIYSSGGKTINAFHLKSPQFDSKTIYQSSAAISTINQITKVNEKVILFDDCPVNQRCSIKKLNINNGDVQFLMHGRLPTYVHDHDLLFFYDSMNGDQWLISTYLGKTDVKQKIAKAPKKIKLENEIKRSITTPVIMISSNDIVFNGEENRLRIYQIKKSQSRPTDIYNCIPILWRSKTKQILCEDISNRNFVLFNINSGLKEELPLLVGSYGHLYLSEYDSLIYGRTRYRFPIGEGYDIFSYSFKERKELKIKSNTHIKCGLWIN